MTSIEIRKPRAAGAALSLCSDHNPSSFMPTLLHLDVSPRGEFSISRQLSKAGVAAWKTKYPNGKIIERDLTKNQMTFVDLDLIMGAFSPPEQVSEQHKSALAISDTLIGELLAADDIIIGTP